MRKLKSLEQSSYNSDEFKKIITEIETEFNNSYSEDMEAVTQKLMEEQNISFGEAREKAEKKFLKIDESV